MKQKYKIVIRKIVGDPVTFQVEQPYFIQSIHGAAGVKRMVGLRIVAPEYNVGDRLTLETVKELIDNPDNDVTITL